MVTQGVLERVRGVRPPLHTLREKRMTERNQTIIEMYLGRKTLQEIGDEYGLTRERVRQIVAPFVSERHYGSAKREARDLKILEAHGRIQQGWTSVEEEAELLGLLPDTLRVNFRKRGLKLKVHRAPEHGTRHRYQQGCKCDECLGALRDYMASLKGKEPPHHGTASGYGNYGCRCDSCKEAGSIQQHVYRERRKQRAQLDAVG